MPTTARMSACSVWSSQCLRWEIPLACRCLVVNRVLRCRTYSCGTNGFVWLVHQIWWETGWYKHKKWLVCLQRWRETHPWCQWSRWILQEAFSWLHEWEHTEMGSWLYRGEMKRISGAHDVCTKPLVGCKNRLTFFRFFKQAARWWGFCFHIGTLLAYDMDRAFTETDSIPLAVPISLI